MKMNPFHSIEQFRGVVKNVNDFCTKNVKPVPTLTFKGTVKLHGTNAAVCWGGGKIWCQSRNNIITTEKDNAGFANYMHVYQDSLFMQLFAEHPYLKDVEETIVVYGEWCGGSIQKNVALTGMEKMFVIFKIGVIYGDKTVWQNIPFTPYLDNIHHIDKFPTFSIDIDFNSPLASQNTLVETTNAVEKECPVAKYFGVSGVGEGVVWTEWETTNGALTFKVKGEEHSVSKVKTLAAVDVEKMENIGKFVEYAVTEQRLQQGVQYLEEQHLDVDVKNLSVFLKWLSGDIVKEESDVLEESGFTYREVGGMVSKHARTWFINLCNSKVGL